MKKVLPYNEIELRLQQLSAGEVFDNSYFNIEANKKETLAKLLSRKVEEGQLARLAKGKYYKPKTTIFGTLAPVTQQVINSFTQKNGKIIGYITGIKAYQERRLTTQMPTIIEIAIQGKAKPFQKIGNYQFRFVSRNFAFTENQVPILQLLDALKDIKRIPDAPVSETIQTIKEIIRQMNTADAQIMVELAQNYAPFVKALLGAIVQEVQPTILLTPLFDTLNPLSVYKIGIKNNSLKYQKNWKIR
jgi:predicted transcriptional regulator of viral defense system